MQSKLCKVKLSEVLNQVKDTFDVDVKISYRQITVSKSGAVILREEKIGALIGTKKQTEVKSGWFIYSRLGLPDGAFGIIPKNLDGAIVTGDMPVFKITEEKILPDYLNYILRNSFVFDYFRSKFKGSAQSRVRENLFLSLEIPLPTLAEQKRIVAKIKEIEEKTNEIIKVSAYAQRATGSIIPSTLNNIFENKNWNQDKIGNLIEDIKTGTTPATGETKYFKEEISWFTPADFQGQMYLENSSRKVSNLAIRDGKVKLYKANSLLFIGIGATLGKVGIIKKSATSNQQITAILFKKNIVPEFAYYWFVKNYFTIRALCPATTLPILNQEKIKNLLFTYPDSTKEQKEIVEHLNLLEEKRQQIILEREKQAKMATALMPSILAKAFNGVL